ncbi:Ribosomal RNA large subunit methyltransferase J [Pseudoalteromonas sp. THAF3]|uniref:23S rRNA (adenine(2030)-N(6))-methyltransferase RlmJ n=1 Tax=Pseudoalteromonas TaxID=53246 RepID=UPI001246B00E|nr:MULTISPECIES: 23S rRNA (adenine(2030)-N(6))-methyltransferase RlmJ [Pseudoalteromonas]QFU05880.1 Ribosomal RNA large subunit methyltransferase J [Pseudoalteromonas sp. THAF3]
MLSYRHSFHAGNPADVVKHLVLAQTLQHMVKKEKPFDYIDTHSGAGFFAIDNADMQKTQEFNDGIAKLWQYQGDVDALADYVALIKGMNESAQLRHYPGSPKVAEHYLRKQDKGWFFELHPQDLKLLQKNMAGKRSLRVKDENGFKGLLALVPPLSRRACVLMDPPYEVKSDYDKAVDTFIKAHQRFSTGTYLLWYPVVERSRIDRLEQRFIDSGIRNIQLFELATQGDSEERGMTASGIIAINPPYTLKATMQQVLPELVKVLSEQDGFYRCEQLVDE